MRGVVVYMCVRDVVYVYACACVLRGIVYVYPVVSACAWCSGTYAESARMEIFCYLCVVVVVVVCV